MRTKLWVAATLGAAIAGVSLCPSVAHANLCQIDKLTDRHRQEAALIAREAFAPSSPAYRGGAEYNAWVLACNRARDHSGGELDRAISPTSGGSFAKDLPPVIVKSKLNYYGTAFTALKYAYRLRREKGEWIVTLPISFHFPDRPIVNRLDIPEELALKLRLKSTTAATAGKRRCDKGAERLSSETRKGERLVDTGFIVSDDGSACRLPRNLVLPDGRKLLDRYHEFWKSAIQTAWTRPGFRLEVVFPEYSSRLLPAVDGELKYAFEKDEVTWKIRFSDNPEKRATYKPVPFKWENAPMSMSGSTIAHESGHYLGLDDEYREGKPTDRNDWRDCSDHGGEGYIMCYQGYARGDSPEDDRGGIGVPEAAKGIYAWIITRRYALAKAEQCGVDSDCESGEFCRKGPVGLGRNACTPRLADGRACTGDNQCGSGECSQWRPQDGQASGICYTPASKAGGEACRIDLECKAGKCNSQKQCVCDSDSDCQSGFWCDVGADTHANTCKRKLDKGETCGPAGLNIGHRCKSGSCKVSGLSLTLKCQ